MNKKLVILFIGVMSLFGANNLPIKQQDVSPQQLQKQNRQIVKLAAQELSKQLPQKVDKYTTIVDIKSKDPIKYAENYFDLKFQLEDLLERKIDLLEERGIKNLYLKENIDSSKYSVIKLPIAGPYSLISANATKSEKELASKIAITYAKSSPQEKYSVTIDDEVFEVSPFSEK